MMPIAILLLVGAVQAGFLAFVLAFNKNKDLASKWLIAWLLFITIHLLFVHFGFSGVYKEYPLLLIFGSALMLLQGPFLFLYTAILTNRIKSLNVWQLLHAVPYLFYTCYIAVVLMEVDAPNRYEHISGIIDDPQNLMMLSLGLLNHLHIMVYLVLSILLLKKHSKSLTDTFSYLEDINLKWLKNLLIGITVVAVVILFGLLTSDLFPFISHYAKATLIYSALAILPFYMSFYAIRQKLIFPLHADLLNVKYEASRLTKKESAKIAEQLVHHMQSNKPYLNPKLSIKDLSDDLGLHPKDLSRVINENFEKNFFNFINEYRVDEFISKIKDPKHDRFTLIAIAYDCGFNTKSSFNSIFKKTKGMTPSAFKARLT
ncbi:AraC family transcriptional regulator [Allomuricauda sp. SCSIO 65647]|uniref:helix-turn-helix domain-containing protein n=1 Tax=Allomuricauda sp. SCSIO 65647 TaxID=2908843 RepID=UPI001F44720A|nr:AraC family transcriptional regulator [Muricauda sp. SCSIO 65647]UJH67294.1 AraC family transcriptional regulator [Muricauda sp. SCSIO 65647]